VFGTLSALLDTASIFLVTANNTRAPIHVRPNPLEVGAYVVMALAETAAVSKTAAQIVEEFDVTGRPPSQMHAFKASPRVQEREAALNRVIEAANGTDRFDYQVEEATRRLEEAKRELKDAAARGEDRIANRAMGPRGGVRHSLVGWARRAIT
jgi:hypothetical protein